MPALAHHLKPFTNSHKRIPSRTLALLAAGTLTLSIAACTSSSPPENEADIVSSGAATENPAQADGPHAAADRPLAPRQVTRNEVGTVQRASVDLGNITEGAFSAPLRGDVFAPTQAAQRSELIILSHLRAPNCQDMSFSYPCAPGIEEFRYDQGMSYLGEHLAAQGYTVVVPDLGGIFIGADLEAPYSQTRMWSTTVKSFIDAIASDSVGQTDILGLTYAAPVDTSSVGLFVHSRSGMLVDTAATLLGEEHLKSVFAYGPAYDTVDLENISTAPADIPYLALVGDQDADVGPSSNLWLGHYASTPRKSAASVAELPGLGHMFINRAASAAHFDDRVTCDVLQCASASEHERVVMETSAGWFNATLRNQPTDLPVQADQSLPLTVADLPARWLALTPGADGFVEPTTLSPQDSADSGNTDDAVTVCVNADPMIPIRPENACPEPATGLMQVLTPVAFVNGSAHAQVNFPGLRTLAVHVAPVGVAQGSPGVPITITFVMEDGQEFTHQVPREDPAVKNRFGPHDNGTYRLGTVRVPVPTQVTHGKVSTIRLTTPSPIEVRSIDLLN